MTSRYLRCGRFGPGLAGVLGDVDAGVVGFGWVDPAFEAVLLPGAGVVPVVDVVDEPLPDVGVAAGAETGSDVSGVGSGGKGFDRIPATNSGRPASDLLLRYL